MSKRYILLSMLLVAFFIAGLSMGQPANNTSKEKITSQQNITAKLNETEKATSIESPNLNYIWSVSGLEPEQVTMVLKQAGEELYGAAKYESDSGQSWNAVVIGSTTGDNVDLIITALKGKELISSKLSGRYDNGNQTIDGKFFSASENEISGKGNFNAMWINPDTSSYVPAKIEEPKPATQAPGETSNINATAATGEISKQPVQLGKTRFTDVRQYKDKVLTGVGDISQVPIGMGGAGL